MIFAEGLASSSIQSVRPLCGVGDFLETELVSTPSGGQTRGEQGFKRNGRAVDAEGQTEDSAGGQTEDATEEGAGGQAVGMARGGETESMARGGQAVGMADLKQDAGDAATAVDIRIDQEPAVESIQGEYLGWLVVDGVRREYGLQVVARGESQFTAGLLPGGLPSHGNLNPHPTKLSGGLSDGQLNLESSGGLVFQLRTEPNYHFVQLDRRGQEMARLERVRRRSASLGLAPPPNALVLFRDGVAQELDQVKLTPDGHLSIGAVTRFPVDDFRLHVEFRLPLQAEKSNQDRGNSGIYMQRRYEIQILDSFGEPPSNNNAASIYRQRPPKGSLSLPPLAWQTYDIWFTAARWSPSGEKIRNARVTVAHNGVVVHRDVEIVAKTGAGRAEGPDPLPILFQDHGDPVEFRNVWLVQPTGQTSLP